MQYVCLGGQPARLPITDTGKFPFGAPVDVGQVKEYPGHTLYYDAARKQPVWVAELINKESIKGKDYSSVQLVILKGECCIELCPHYIDVTQLQQYCHLGIAYRISSFQVKLKESTVSSAVMIPYQMALQLLILIF